MAQNAPNWNILIVGGVIIGGLYFWNKIKTGNTATDYVSGVTGSNISDASQGTIRRDIRQDARTQRVIARNPVAEDYTSGLTGAVISDASQGTIKTDLRQTARVIAAADRQQTRITLAENRQDTRIEKTKIRQEARTTRASNRQATRRANVAQIVSIVKKTPKPAPIATSTNMSTAQKVYSKINVNPYARF